jgi:hypothetical protein
MKVGATRFSADVLVSNSFGKIKNINKKGKAIKKIHLNRRPIVDSFLLKNTNNGMMKGQKR